MTDDGPARLVVLVSGRGSNMMAVSRAVDAGLVNARIAAVFSDRARADALRAAGDRGLDTVTVDRRRFRGRDAFEESLATAIDGFEPTWVVLAGFMRVLGQSLVEHYRGRLVNIHPSLLPKYRGLDTHQRVLDAGDADHGASVHFVTPALDAGPVISQVHLDVQAGDSADTLAERLLPLEHRLYPATLALLGNHRVELIDETIHLDNKPLDRPLVLDRDLSADGRLLDGGHGR